MITLIKNARLVNEGKITAGDVLIKDKFIEKMASSISHPHAVISDAGGRFLLPGLIDDQVHFREPGLTHKATIYTESRAAAAGGITSFMEMPNTIPPVFTQSLLEEKYAIASRSSWVNYSFFMGASNDNLEEAMKTDLKKVCGLKIFMGSSTGNLLVDNTLVLEKFFSRFPGLIATHCEDEETILNNLEIFKQQYGDDIPIAAHPKIRSAEACYKSSSNAVALAKKYGTKLNVLHISAAKELELFEHDIPLEKKKITAEVCLHHLWFCAEDYAALGTLLKWNPSVKTAADREALWKGLLQNQLDLIATDHAPHTKEEKNNPYLKAPSGGPLAQHSLAALLECFHNKKISLEKIVEKACHNPAVIYKIDRRGFLREGYFADLVLADLNAPWTVSEENILSKCRWSPFNGTTFRSKVQRTWVSGKLVYENGQLLEGQGERLAFL